MANVSFTPNLERHLHCPVLQVNGSTLKEILDGCCVQNPGLRIYIQDDQGRLRHHVAVFIDSLMVTDKVNLDQPVAADSEVFVMQALTRG